jgi:hypothetical protein
MRMTCSVAFPIQQHQSDTTCRARTTGNRPHGDDAIRVASNITAYPLPETTDVLDKVLHAVVPGPLPRFKSGNRLDSVASSGSSPSTSAVYRIDTTSLVGPRRLRNTSLAESAHGCCVDKKATSWPCIVIGRRTRTQSHPCRLPSSSFDPAATYKMMGLREV